MRLILVGLLFCAGAAEAGKKNRKKDAPATEQVQAAPAAPTTDPVVLPCNWSEGLTFHYEYRKVRHDARQPQVSGVTATSPVTVTVTQSGNPAGFNYVAGQPTLEGPQDAVANMTEMMMGETEAPPMHLIMHDGVVDTIANLDEVVDAMVPLLQKMVPADAPPEMVESTIGMFRNPQTGSPLLLKDPGKLFAMHCVGLTPGQVIEAPSSFPNPFGGPPLPGTSVIDQVVYDVDNQLISFRTQDSLSPDFIKGMLPELFQQFLPGVEMTEARIAEFLANAPPVENNMVGTMTYSVEDGFPIFIDIQQEIGNKNHQMHRVERWTWTRVDPPAE